MNDLFCSDICLSLSASLNALAVGSLPCSLPGQQERPGLPILSMAEQPEGTRRWRVILASALTGRDGRYNGKAVSKEAVPGVLAVGGGGVDGRGKNHARMGVASHLHVPVLARPRVLNAVGSTAVVFGVPQLLPAGMR